MNTGYIILTQRFYKWQHRNNNVVIIADLQWVKISKYRFGVLSALNERMKSPSEIANELNFDLPNISRTLSQLSSKGYIVNKTPDFWKNKLFEITHRGKETLKNIEAVLS